MDIDQIQKRVQWIDEERRKDKEAIALLENHLRELEGKLNAAHTLIKEQSGEIARLSAVVTRMDQFDNSLMQVRIESKRLIEEMDKETKKREDEAEKVRKVEMKALESGITDVRKDLEPLPRFEKAIQTRVEEDVRLGRLIDELRGKIDQVRHSEDEYTRTYRLLEDGRRQDSKRITDLIGEVTALRKRSDDQRGQAELVNNSIRKIETRLQELVVVETERRDAQANFLDRQNLLQVERDRVWKDWETRFQTIERQAGEIEAQLQKLDVTFRDTKRSQQALDDLSQRVERRINEITEIQRLSEDRFRQEWVTFKADDQKRWTNYTLIAEESRGENNRQSERMTDRITEIEDLLQEERDVTQQSLESSEKRLQSLLALVHEWVAEFERSAGRAR